MPAGKIRRLLEPLKEYRDSISGIHILGRKKAGKNMVAHVGTLDDLVGNNKELKTAFLAGL